MLTMSPQNAAVTRTDGYVIYYTEKIGKDNVPDQTRSVDIRSAKYGISNSAVFAICDDPCLSKFWTLHEEMFASRRQF